MERESFEDEEVAKILNEHYITVKVDREERPDIDSIYMSACQAVTGQGGWPLTIIMAPNGNPFFAGTYFPKTEKYGRPGLLDILSRIKCAWDTDKDRLIAIGGDITEAIKGSPMKAEGKKLDSRAADNAFEIFQDSFDKAYGGFGDAPKFPTPHNLIFLLRYWKAEGNDNALNMAEKTLEGMYRGGIFDHIGFGFFRYSTDDSWLVPHFEKMLYDNALLAYAYTEGYRATGKGLYKDIAHKIFNYVIRDMTSLGGGFYSAKDADSEKKEGKFYLWRPEEIKDIVGEEDGEVFCKYYDIKPEGNFEGKSIPNLIKTDFEGLIENKELTELFDTIRERLFAQREKRIRPHKDDKILTSWNGLMIAALALGGRVFDNEEYIERAEVAFNFIQNKLIRSDGRLLARYRDGEAAFLAYLDDYAFLIWGLIELYRATFKSAYLERALKLNRDMLKLFWDERDGGLFLYGRDGEQLIMRPKEVYDGALPSGNSVALYNILHLSRMTGDTKLKEKADKILDVFKGEVSRNPAAHPFFMAAFMFDAQPNRDVVLAARFKEDAEDMLRKINSSYMPFATIMLNTKDEGLYRIAPFTREQKMVDGKPTAYVCTGFACMPPIIEADELLNVFN